MKSVKTINGFAHKFAEIWRPEIGQKVTILAGGFKGQTGEVLRNRGQGKFQIKLEDGRTIPVRSIDLRGL